MGSRVALDAGSFVVGEIPAPLEYQYLDETGLPLDLTGYGVATFDWSRWPPGTGFLASITRAASVSDPLNGKVTYVWQGDEVALPGRHAGMFFVSNGTNRFASLLLAWQVCTAT